MIIILIYLSPFLLMNFMIVSVAYLSLNFVKNLVNYRIKITIWEYMPVEYIYVSWDQYQGGIISYM